MDSRFAGLLNPEEALEMAEQFSWGEFLPLAGASVAISVAGISLAVLAYALRRIDLGQRCPWGHRSGGQAVLQTIGDSLEIEASGGPEQAKDAQQQAEVTNPINHKSLLSGVGGTCLLYTSPSPRD